MTLDEAKAKLARLELLEGLEDATVDGYRVRLNAEVTAKTIQQLRRDIARAEGKPGQVFYRESKQK